MDVSCYVQRQRGKDSLRTEKGRKTDNETIDNRHRPTDIGRKRAVKVERESDK